jgi:prolyl-tRNA editing enzyme YbaK/EbsC (Cys-tRNA(Pro) deacylase)
MEVRVFPEGTKTAQDAAKAVGCPVSAIVKSLVFVVAGPDGTEEPVLALVPGDLRLDTEALAVAANATRSRRASLEEVRVATGYAAGGTPPFGHSSTLRVFADEALRRNDPVWAAAGTPTTVFPISLEDLDRLAQPQWAKLAVDPPPLRPND